MSKKKPSNKKSSKKIKESSIKAAKTRLKKSKWSIFQSAPTHDQDKLYKKLFYIIFGIVAIATLFIALQSGVNEDDKFHYAYSEILLNFYSSFGQDTGALNVERGRMHLYGGVVDILSGVFSKLFGVEQSATAYPMIRHFVIGCLGLLSFLFTGLIGKKVGGWRAGIFAMLILFLSPRFLGHTGINPRDIPFASGYIMSVYFMIRFFGEIPKVSWKTMLGLAAGLGLAFATRSGALLLFAYFGLFGLIHMWRSYKENISSEKNLLSKYLLYGTLSGVGGYVIGLLFWPFGLVNPIKNVLFSLTEFSNYKTVLRMLFQGDMTWSSEIPPATYISSWLGISLPLILICGIILFFVFAKTIFNRNNRFYVGIVAFIFIFPIIYILYKQSNLYNCMRHFIFVVPPLAVLAALGWEALIHRFEIKKPVISYGVAGFMGLLALLPLSHIITNGSACYVYYNELVGGVKGALGNYEMDYWGISNKQAAAWMGDQGYFDGEDEVVVASNSNFVLQQYLNKYDNVKVKYVRFRERYESTWDYAVMVNQFVDGAHLRAGKYLDANVVKIIGKGDSPFSIIYKNPEDRFATKAFEALKSGKPTEAISLFAQEVQVNPNNENAWYGMGQSYFNIQQYEQAENALLQALEINPGSQAAISYLSLALLNQNKLDASLTYLTKAIELNPRDYNSRYYRGLIYSRQGNQSKALTELNEVLKINARHKQTFDTIIQIYTQQGNTQQANYYRQLKAQYVK